MDLWIRSQDREYLGKVEEIILIYDCLCSDEVQLFHIDSDKARLGSYETKERALEVLDEIQDKLCPQDCINIGYGTIVYEMPKE